MPGSENSIGSPKATSNWNKSLTGKFNSKYKLSRKIVTIIEFLLTRYAIQSSK